VQSPFQKLYASFAENDGECFICKCNIGRKEGIGLRQSSNKLYCEEHFCCENCEEQIEVGSSFIVRHNFPYCKNCVNKKLPQCQLCHLQIAGDFIEALGSSWHVDHFLCNHCHIPLTETFGQDGFFEHQGNQYCETDYFNLFIDKKEKETEKEESKAKQLSVQPNKTAKSPFASPLPVRRGRKSIKDDTKRASSPVFTRVKRKQTLTLRSSETAFKIPKNVIPATPRKLLEQEKRGSFLLQKETPAEYVHIRSSLSTFHANSEVCVSRKGSRTIDLGIEPELPKRKEEKPQERTEQTETIIEPMRTSGTVSKETLEETVIGKKLVPQSIQVKDITKILQFCDIVGKGGFATVREGTMIGSKESVAVKIFNKWELSDEALIFIKV